MRGMNISRPIFPNGQIVNPLEQMTTEILLTAYLAIAFFTAYKALTAPEGYEDATGWHEGEEPNRPKL